MNKKIVTIVALSALLLLPVMSLAYTSTPEPSVNPGLNVDTLIALVVGIVWKVLVAIAVILLVYSGISFVLAQGDPAKIATARQFLLWGVVGVAVAVLAFSIPFVLKSFFS